VIETAVSYEGTSMKKKKTGIILCTGNPHNGVRAELVRVNLGGPLLKLLEDSAPLKRGALLQMGSGEFQVAGESNYLLKGGRSGG
jgi:hypothetical protein